MDFFIGKLESTNKIKLSLAFVIVFVVVVVLFHQNIISLIVLPQYIVWAAQTEAAGIQVGEPPSEKQLAAAKKIGIKYQEKVRLVYVDEVPFPRENVVLNAEGEALGFIGEGIINKAQVFGYSIDVRKEYELTTPNLAHKLVHVLQIKRSDLTQVITQHFTDLAAHSY